MVRGKVKAEEIKDAELASREEALKADKEVEASEVEPAAESMIGLEPEELRAALDRALENGRFGAEAHPDYPALQDKQRPRLLSVIYGLGGLPLRGADLIALCRKADGIRRPQVYLGIRFSRTTSAYPKRQVLLDRLRHRSRLEQGRQGGVGTRRRRR